ncbi:MAG: hypothetical protein IPN53_07445 [Comamonadaceae bacterium]|nr:hypothetical protein [Comamonadaceae bacterium]
MSKRVLTISTLGKFGDFGNQLFQLCFGIGLARHLGAELQIPNDWVGYKIFNIRLPEIEIIPIAKTPIDYIPNADQIEKHHRIDLIGFWQFQEAIDMFSKNDISQWLVFQSWILEKFRINNVNKFRKIAIHKRRGDYLKPENIDRFCCISNRSFYKCLYTQVFQNLEKNDASHVFEVSEENRICDDFCDSLNIGFIPDFMSLVSADIVIRSNSSFSFWASALGGDHVYSPVVKDCVGWSDVDFVAGNHPALVSSTYFPGHKISDMQLKKVWHTGASACQSQRNHT